MELVEIGFFGKTHGIKGHLLLKLTENVNTDLLKVVFIEQHGSKVPLFVNSLTETPQGLLVSLEETDSIEKAKVCVNKKVLAEDTVVITENDDGDLSGYELRDKHFGSMGNVTAISDNGAQDLFVLFYNEKEVMLPVVDAFVESIDHERKVVHYNAPEGLIELFLED